MSVRAQTFVIGTLITGCAGEGDPCVVDPLQCIVLTPDTVTLDPRDYRTRPAVGYFGVRNDSAVEMYVSPKDFAGENAELLTVRDDQDMVVLPAETLLLDVSYQPLAEQWQHGAFVADLSLEIGWFDSPVRGTAAVRRREAGDSYDSRTWSAEIRFEWDCDVDDDGYLGDACGQTDCNDQNPDIHPDADETCDRIDNNCDGVVDNDAVDGRAFYFDGDNDGWGDSEQVVMGCQAPSTRYVTQGGDCDDEESFATPGGFEWCDDGIDGNCDGVVDEGCD
jgi:hypothetical protein